MINEEPTLTFIIFLLAIIGYAGMTSVVLLSLNKPIPILLWRIIVVIIFAHVLLIWVHRYQMQFEAAIRNGYSGFIIFHSALLIILISTVVKQNTSRLLVRISFIIISAGAIGATFKYDIVSIYKIPVLLLAISGMFGLIRIYFNNRKQKFTS